MLLLVQRRCTFVISGVDFPSYEPTGRIAYQSVCESVAWFEFHQRNGASLRNLQLGKVKSLPSSWNKQMGCSSRYGSPRGSILRPGFCSCIPLQHALRPESNATGLVKACISLQWHVETEPLIHSIVLQRYRLLGFQVYSPKFMLPEVGLNRQR